MCPSMLQWDLVYCHTLLREICSAIVCDAMICRLRTLHNADVHIRRTHMASREPKYRHRMAKGFKDATEGWQSMKLKHSGQFPRISTSVCTGRKAYYTLWAQPKLFTLSNITSYNAAFTILHLCTFCQTLQRFVNAHTVWVGTDKTLLLHKTQWLKDQFITFPPFL